MKNDDDSRHFVPKADSENPPGPDDSSKDNSKKDAVKGKTKEKKNAKEGKAKAKAKAKSKSEAKKSPSKKTQKPKPSKKPEAKGETEYGKAKKAFAAQNLGWSYSPLHQHLFHVQLQPVSTSSQCFLCVQASY